MSNHESASNLKPKLDSVGHCIETVLVDLAHLYVECLEAVITKRATSAAVDKRSQQKYLQYVTDVNSFNSLDVNLLPPLPILQSVSYKFYPNFLGVIHFMHCMQ